MRLPKDFESYVREGMIRRTAINKERAGFFINESEISYGGLKKRVGVMGIDRENSNSIIKDCYDIILELIRAKLLLEGYVSSGNYAHEAEISYLKVLGFGDNDLSFLNELRYNRNSIMYYGKLLDRDYAALVFEYLEKIYNDLKLKVKNV